MERKLVYVGFAFTHHKNTHAGYHQIKNYLKYDYIIDCQKYFDKGVRPFSSLSLFGKVYRKVLNIIFHVNNIPWYIAKIAYLGIFHRNYVFHFIYGETIFFPIITKILPRKNIFVCTLHQPFSFFLESKRRQRILKSADYIILVSNTEVDKFEQFTGKNNIHYIPHGISDSFYKIEPGIKKTRSVLTVGSWLRDYEFANRVYQKLLLHDPNMVINIVTNEHNASKIEKNCRIKFYSHIPDHDLKMLYLTSGVLFLPLQRYTANNSLLEAGATGCNIVIASDFPDNSYIPKEFITLVRMDVEQTVRAIEQTMSNNFNIDLSNYIKTCYGWEITAKDTESYLLSIR